MDKLLIKNLLLISRHFSFVYFHPTANFKFQILSAKIGQDQGMDQIKFEQTGSSCKIPSISGKSFHFPFPYFVKYLKCTHSSRPWGEHLTMKIYTITPE